MNNIRESIENRLEQLDKWIRQKEKAGRKAPPGRLCVNYSKKTTQYYHVTGKDSCGKYLNKRQDALIRSLAQKEYDKKVLQKALREKAVLERALKTGALGTPEEVFAALSEGRKKLVRPIRLTDEEYIREWEAVTYERKGFDESFPEYYTEKGERVRSKSEAIIANKLREMGIPYRYEQPITLQGGIIRHPDFTILHVRERSEKYLEHLGMVDDPNYMNRTLRRINMFQSSGIYYGKQLFLTFESKEFPLNSRRAEDLFSIWFQ